MVTINDIAKQANVSRSAVSLALNNKTGVSDETRQKILDAANELGYNLKKKPSENNLIRFLVCINSDTVSSHFYESPFYMALIRDIEHECQKRGFALLISSTDIDELEENLIQYEKNHPALGLILLGTYLSQSEILAVQKRQPNLVVLDNILDLLNIDCVGANMYMLGYQAASYIIDSGFEKIGYVQAKRRPNNLIREKEGFIRKLSESSMKIQKNHIYSITNSTYEGSQDFREILKTNIDNLPEILFCEDDFMAIGVMQALTEAGKRIPEDISVMGSDNVFLSETSTPPLTTIQIDTRTMSKVGVNRIVEMINSKNLPTMKFIIDTFIVERESCKKKK